MPDQSHYPEFNVMDEKEHWDEHTRGIVESRLIREKPYKTLSDVEAEVLRSVCSILADVYRGEVIQYALCHIDEVLASNNGESERKPGVPKQDALVRAGIAALQEASLRLHQQSFIGLDEREKRRMLASVCGNQAEPVDVWKPVPQREWFSKVLKLTLESVYSHPVVWSEIGYAGPAYPRGYVRTGVGQLDPWEARNVHTTS